MFDMSYMPWDKFKEGVLSLDKEFLLQISKQDCVMGGIDYTVDYRYE